MADIGPKSDLKKKKKSCLLPTPTLQTTRITLSSGPESGGKELYPIPCQLEQTQWALQTHRTKKPQEE